MGQPLTRLNYPLNPLFAGGDGQNTEPLPTEPVAVEVLGPCRFVGEQFPLKTGPIKVAAGDRHGVTVGFEEIPTLIPVGLQAKNPVGNDAAFLPLADVHLPLKRFAHIRDSQIVH